MSHELNKQVLMDKFNFDDEDIVMLFDVFIKSSNENIAKLKQAIEDNDYDAIYLCSHSLKGSSGNLLVDEVYDLSKKIESASKDKKSIDYTAYCDKIHAIFQNLTLK